MTTVQSHYLFLLASARRYGNSEQLAQRAAQALQKTVTQRWLHLREFPLSPFEDHRHDNYSYLLPTGSAQVLCEASLKATDLVFVAPVYWYGLPADAKLYLDHWSHWMRIPELRFKERMADKTMWVISCFSGDDRHDADALFKTLQLSAHYLNMRWGGMVLGRGSRPGDILIDNDALAAADQLFTN